MTTHDNDHDKEQCELLAAVEAVTVDLAHGTKFVKIVPSGIQQALKVPSDLIVLAGLVVVVLGKTTTTTTTGATTSQLLQSMNDPAESSLFVRLQMLYHQEQQPKSPEPKQESRKSFFRWSPNLCPKEPVQKKISAIVEQRLQNLQAKSRRAAKALLRLAQQQQQQNDENIAAKVNRSKQSIVRQEMYMLAKRKNSEKKGEPEQKQKKQSDCDVKESCFGNNHMITTSKVEGEGENLHHWEHDDKTLEEKTGDEQNQTFFLLPRKQHDDSKAEWTTIPKRKRPSQLGNSATTLTRPSATFDRLAQNGRDNGDGETTKTLPNLEFKAGFSVKSPQQHSATTATAHDSREDTDVTTELAVELTSVSKLTLEDVVFVPLVEKVSPDAAPDVDGGEKSQQAPPIQASFALPVPILASCQESKLGTASSNYKPISQMMEDAKSTNEILPQSRMNANHLIVLQEEENDAQHRLLSRVRELELQLAQSRDCIQQERLQAQQLAIKAEREAFQEREQALQLRLYIAESRLETFETALQQHIHAVNENTATRQPMSPSCNTAVNDYKTSEPSETTNGEPADSLHCHRPLYSRVLKKPI